MLKSNTGALGIIFSNTYDAFVPELVNLRLMASIPFASRYRMIDFILSSMSNCDITNIAIMVNQNYHSLMDHLGSGREWDLVRKNGGLSIYPPSAEKTSGSKYIGKVNALNGILGAIKARSEKYVVIADSNIAVNFDFKKMLAAHEASGADITIAYNEQPIPQGLLSQKDNSKGFYYTLEVEEGRVRKLFVNTKETGIQNFAMNIYVVNRELLIDLINNASIRGQQFFEREILLQNLDRLNVQGYKYDGYVSRVIGMKSYFDENMRLLDDHNLDALFSPAPIYTKIRDDNPTRYKNGSQVQNAMIADGCLIEGEVENSILFRGVKVAKGAKVKNCILMQDTVIEAGASVEYLITDKQVTVTAGKEMKGTDTFPFYIAKQHTV
jgi:glucose-1-phosphate adenylyltransferase